MRLLKAITKSVVNIVLIIFIVTMFLYASSKYILKSDVPNVFGFSILKVISGSMEPTIQIGDYIVIKKSSNYKQSDIVTYKDKNNNLVTHRIVQIEDYVITKGDNNNIEDDVFNKDKIQGKVILIVHNLFKSVNTVNVVIVLITILVIGCLITMIIPDRKKELKNEKR